MEAPRRSALATGLPSQRVLGNARVVTLPPRGRQSCVERGGGAGGDSLANGVRLGLFALLSMVEILDRSSGVRSLQALLAGVV